MIRIVKLLIITYILFFWFKSSAQIHEAESCGSHRFIFSIPKIIPEPWHGNNEFLHKYLDSLGADTGSETILYRIPVKIHMHQNSHGKGGISQAQLKKQINYLNHYHSINRTGIRFYLKPGINYIRKKRFYKTNFILETTRVSGMQNDKSAVNVHFVRNLATYFFGNVKKSYYGVHNKLTDGIIVRERTATATITHEVGHFFGLKHPHKHNNRGRFKQEPVSRTRGGLFGPYCERRADKLADTPAEPDLSRDVTQDCKYIGTERDSWGDLYNPDTDNIMSYGKYRECRDKFTRGQKAIMLYTLSKKKYADEWGTRYRGARNYEFDAFEPDDTPEMASEIFFNTPQVHTYHKIFNGKRYLDSDDLADNMILNVKSSKSFAAEIIVSKGKRKMPPVNLAIYRNGRKLKSINIRAGKTGSLKVKLKKGDYIIQVTNKQPLNQISDYKIEVKK